MGETAWCEENCKHNFALIISLSPPNIDNRHGLNNQSFLEDITVHMPNHKHDYTFFQLEKETHK
jgi:hypothetical protein